jgi:beta-carotene ketolase (CrtW type)
MRSSIQPPTYRWKGIIVACCIFTAWALLMVVALSTPTVSVWFVVPAVPLLTFLYVGLFITAHDSMHGLVAPSHPRLNRGIGTLAVTMYALFSYKLLLAEHKRHHNQPGSSEDPDFHNERHSSFIAWYLNFMWHYVTIWQLAKISLVVNILTHFAGVETQRILVFFAMPALLSSLQLFYFGTYLPHRRTEEGFEDRHNARSNNFSELLSLFTCYHFGYHWEHHEYPFVPWWRLPAVRRLNHREHTSNG